MKGSLSSSIENLLNVTTPFTIGSLPKTTTSSPITRYPRKSSEKDRWYTRRMYSCVWNCEKSAVWSLRLTSTMHTTVYARGKLGGVGRTLTIKKSGIFLSTSFPPDAILVQKTSEHKQNLNLPRPLDSCRPPVDPIEISARNSSTSSASSMALRSSA